MEKETYMEKIVDGVAEDINSVNQNSDNPPTCKARTYQYPASMLKKVAELLGVEEEFATIETISLNFLASSAESKEGFPPVLFVVVGGVTHAEHREKERKVYEAIASTNRCRYAKKDD